MCAVLQRIIRRPVVLLLLLVLTPAPPARAQSGGVALVTVDDSQFPQMRVVLRAQDATGSGNIALDGLQLFENGAPVEGFTFEALPTGVDVTFVIDANRSIAGIDLIGDVSRLEKVRAALIDYVRRSVGRGVSDRISVLAPVDGAPQWVVQDVGNVEQLVDWLTAYDPGALAAEAPIQTLLTLALNHAAAQPDDGRYRAVVLISDAEFLDAQLDLDALLALALADDGTPHAVVFGAILGKVASDRERATINTLAAPTGGYVLHMPETQNLAPILATIDSNRTLTEVTWRSAVRASGMQRLTLALGETTREAAFDLTVEPPAIAVEPSAAPIVRSGPTGAPPAELTPTRVLVTAGVSWPDAHPRRIERVRFFVDGIEQVLPPPVLDARGVLTLEWQITSLAAGDYQLIVEVIDELGLIGRSAPAVQSIALAAPVEAAPTAPPAVPTPSPVAALPTGVAPTATPTARSPLADPQALLQTGWLLTLGLLLVIALLVLVLLRRLRGRAKQRAAAPPTVVRPAERLPQNVYLETLTPLDRRRIQLIPLKGATITVGSDPFSVDVVLDDPTVSRYHARIQFEDGRYVLYDEGSTHGTRVNFDRVGLSPRALADGDELAFGGVLTRLRIFGDAPSDG